MRTEWWSRRAISLHLALVLTVPACGLACWWQTSRAISGNTLSWVYTFEWPFFAAYAAYMWWRLVHEDPREESSPRAPGAMSAAAVLDGGASASQAPGAKTVPSERRLAVAFDPYDDEADPELAAYNRYLAELNASGRQKRW